MFRWQRSKLVAGAAIAVATAVMVAGCGSSDSSSTSSSASASTSGTTAAQDKPVSVAMFPYAFNNPYAEANIAAAKAEAKKLGVDLTLFDSGFDAAKQMSQVEDAISSGKYQGFMISPDDGVAIAPAIEDAAAQNIPVVCFGSPCGPDPASLKPQVDGQLAYVGVSSAKDGAIQAGLIDQACKGKSPCKVAYILGLASNTSETARTNALKAALKSHPNVDLVATVEGKFDRQASYKAAQNLLQAHSDLDVIASGSDQMTLGAEQATKEAGKKIALVGNAASAEGVQATADKRWVGTSVWLPADEASEAVDILANKIRGKGDVPTSVDIRTKSPIGDAVTQDNASQFKAQWHN